MQRVAAEGVEWHRKPKGCQWCRQRIRGVPQHRNLMEGQLLRGLTLAGVYHKLHALCRFTQRVQTHTEWNVRRDMCEGNTCCVCEQRKMLTLWKVPGRQGRRRWQSRYDLDTIIVSWRKRRARKMGILLCYITVTGDAVYFEHCYRLMFNCSILSRRRVKYLSNWME